MSEVEDVSRVTWRDRRREPAARRAVPSSSSSSSASSCWCPLIYLVMALGRIQAGSYAVTTAAREAGRAFVTAQSGQDAAARAGRRGSIAFGDQGFDGMGTTRGRLLDLPVPHPEGPGSRRRRGSPCPCPSSRASPATSCRSRSRSRRATSRPSTGSEAHRDTGRAACATPPAAQARSARRGGASRAPHPRLLDDLHPAHHRCHRRDVGAPVADEAARRRRRRGTGGGERARRHGIPGRCR